MHMLFLWKLFLSSYWAGTWARRNAMQQKPQQALARATGRI